MAIKKGKDGTWYDTTTGEDVADPMNGGRPTARLERPKKSELVTEPGTEISHSEPSPQSIDLPMAMGIPDPLIKTAKAVGHGALNVAKFLGEQVIDRLGPAEARGAIAGLQEGDILEAIKGAGMGLMSPKDVPSGKELFERAGYSGGTPEGMPEWWPSTAGTLGFALDAFTPIAAPLATLKAGGKLAGGAVKGGAKVAAAGAEGAAKAADLLTGTAVGSKTLETAKGVSESVKESGRKISEGLKGTFTADVSPAWRKYEDVIRRNGLQNLPTPPAVKYGPKSAITLSARSEMSNPLLGEVGRQEHAAFKQGVREAFEKNIRDIGGEGVNLDQAGAGAFIRGRFEDVEKELWDRWKDRYSTVAEKYPGMRINTAEQKKISTLAKKIKQDASRLEILNASPSQVAKAKGLRNVANNMELAGSSPENLNMVLNDLRDLAYPKMQPGEMLDVDVKGLRQLLKTGRNAMVNSIPDKAARVRLKQNNREMTKFLGLKKILANDLEGAASAEAAFRNMTGNTEKIKALQSVLSPEAMKVVKGAKLADLLRGDKGFFKLKGEIREGQSDLGALFKGGELDNARDLLELGYKAGEDILPGSSVVASSVLENAKKIVHSMAASRMEARAASKEATRKMAEQGRSKQVLSPSASLGGFSPSVEEFRGIEIPEREMSAAAMLNRLGFGPRKKALQLYGSQARGGE